MNEIFEGIINLFIKKGEKEDDAENNNSNDSNNNYSDIRGN